MGGGGDCSLFVLVRTSEWRNLLVQDVMVPGQTSDKHYGRIRIFIRSSGTDRHNQGVFRPLGGVNSPLCPGLGIAPLLLAKSKGFPKRTISGPIGPQIPFQHIL